MSPPSSSSVRRPNSRNGNTGEKMTKTVALMMSLNPKPIATAGRGGDSGNNASGGITSVDIVLWVCDNDSTPTRSKKRLTYYHYQDHPRQFNHTDALLQRLYPIQVIHVAILDNTTTSTSTTSSAKKKNPNATVDGASVTNPITKRFVSFLQDIIAKQMNSNNGIETTGSQSAAELDSVIVHSNTSAFKANNDAVDFTRLTTIAQQLLGVDSAMNSTQMDTTNGDVASTIDTKGALLQFTGDTYMQQNTIVAKCLQFYLYAVDNAFPNVTDDSIIGSYNQIGIHGHLDSHLVLDSTAAEAIHLWPPANAGQWTVTGGSANNNSIAGIVTSNTCTAMGKRLLYQWLRQPLVNIEELQIRQDAVYELVQRSVGRDAIRDSGLKLFAGNAHDLSKLATNLKKYEILEDNDNDDNENPTSDDNDNDIERENTKKTQLLTSTGNTRKALLALYNLYLVSHEKIPRLVEQLETALSEGGTNCPSPLLVQDCLQQLQQCQAELVGAAELCHAVLDMDAAPSEFFVRRDYKDELVDICADLDTLKSDLDDCHAEMNEKWAKATGISSLNQVRLEYVTNENYGNELKYQFRLPNTNDSKTLESNFGNSIRIHRVLKNGVYFTTAELRKLSSHKAELMAEYNRYQNEIVSQAMPVAASYIPVLYRADVAIALLDALASLAHLAVYSRHGYCRPVLTDSNDDGAGIELVQARHPCVELQENITDFIPNDIKLIFGDSSFLLVTGPNMGGKSTYIRSLGAIVTLAQIGSFVPCKYAKINICHHILARVGAGDLQERGISTFMAEMLESSSILRTATKRSLIIIDELGRGTSTFDGYGLARAISEYIIQKIGCMTVFATHFHELTALEDQERAVKNCHVTAQKGTQGLTFLYEVRPGPCLESFGIQVAEMANVPPVVIRDAKRRARELENFEYRTKKKLASEPATSETTIVDNHEEAEKASAAVALMNQFKRLPLPDILSNNQTDEEKSRALRQLLVGL